jgi:hypothetical protein
MDDFPLGVQPAGAPPRRRMRRYRAQMLASGTALLMAALGVTAVVAQAATNKSVNAAAVTGCGTTDIALNRPTTASSLENGNQYPAAAATDGSTSTRWSSAFSDPQWLEVDLGSTQSICGVSLDWEAAYATAFQIQVSNDNSTWTSIYSTTTGTGGIENLTVSGSGRYIRMYGTARATQYGYSLWEFDVYAGTAATTTTGASSTTTGSTTTTTTASSGVNCSAATSGQTELSQSGWTASTNTDASGGDAVANGIDGNLSTRFSSDEYQAAGQYYEVNLGSSQTFDEIDLQVPNSSGDYARGYSVAVSSNGSSWTTVATCTGTGTPEIASFPTQTAHYVEVTLTAASTTSWWSIDELDLYAAPAPVYNCSASTSGQTQLSQSGWSASTNAPSGTNDAPANGIDGNLSTRFSSDEDQAVGLYYEVNLGSSQTFDELDLQVPNSNGDYARGYTVSVSSNGSSWSTVATCTGTGTPEIVSFTAQTAKYVEVTLTAASTTSWWSIDELDLFASGGGGGTTTTTSTTLGTTTTSSSTSTSTSTSTTSTTVGGGTPPATGGSLGSNVIIFTPSTPQSTIQSDFNSTYSAQQGNQFGTARYAFFFEPGTYGSSSSPLILNLGYYEEVAGLGQNPSQVVINGVINSYNQCSGTTCNSTDNFWRSVYNLTINVNSGGASGCYNDNEDFWASSQDSPMRRVQVNGTLTLMDFCEGPAYASGGFFADSNLTGTVTNGSQQQYFTRTSNIGSWSNAVWNQVFCGDNGAPAQSFASNSGDSGGPNSYTTLATCGPTEEEPYLYDDASGNLNVFVPSVQNNQVGPTWTNGNTPGTSLSVNNTFYVASPSSSAATINAALGAGDNVLFTPGVYNLNATLNVTHANTKLIGLGFATLIPTSGNETINVSDVAGVNISGLIFDAGPVNSPALIQVGTQGSTANYSSNPVTLDDLNIRIGGEEAGSATVGLIDNSNYSIIDNLWAWRADHGAGAGSWTGSDQSNTGVEVNGNNVDAYGLAVEHFQQYETIWNGQGGKVVFFQNENPYDVPSQSVWMASPTQNGYPAFYVPNSVTSFQGYGMGSYSYFDQGVNIENAMGFQSPNNSGDQFHDVFTVFLNGSGGIQSVINGQGAAVSPSNGGPSDVVSYP